MRVVQRRRSRSSAVIAAAPSTSSKRKGGSSSSTPKLTRVSHRMFLAFTVVSPSVTDRQNARLGTLRMGQRRATARRPSIASDALIPAVAAVPFLQRLFGVAAEVPLTLPPLRYFAPGRSKLQHEAHHLGRLWQRRVDGRGKRVHQLWPAWVVQPQSAAA